MFEDGGHRYRWWRGFTVVQKLANARMSRDDRTLQIGTGDRRTVR